MNATTPSKFHRIAVFAYGAAIYVLFLVTFTYTIGFVGNLVVPKSIDSGAPAGLLESILINAAFLALFAIQHTIMARPAFKAWWTKIIPAAAERSTFVLVTCLILIGMFWQWRPMPEVVWSVDHIALKGLLYTIFAAGWSLVLYSSFCIDHFDLFGLRQVVLHLRGKEYTNPGFAMPVLYKVVRNPLMLGFLMAFWATPVMTRGHLLFALLTMGYIFVGIWFEERDLLKSLGESYRQYRERTPMILPLGQRPADAPAISSIDT